MKKAFSHPDLGAGIYVGNEEGLVVVKKDGTQYVWDRQGRFHKERLLTPEEKDAQFRAQTSKADLFKRIIEFYDESYGRETNIEGFRKDMEELRKHTGELTEKQWKKLSSLEYEIEGNANRLFVAIGYARELERAINHAKKCLENLSEAVYAVEGQTERLDRFYQNQVNRS